MWLFIAFMPLANAGDWSGHIATEYRWFVESALDAEQFNGGSTSFSAELEYFHSWNNGKDSVAFVPYVRWDERDAERTHADVRELIWQHISRDWELQLGIGKVYWGVAESQHLVDIINQTDLVENIDGEAKLGQPMINLSFIKDWGVFDLFILPGFRERTFPGQDGRSRSIPEVEEQAAYESGAENKHVDYAMRWSQTYGDWDVGLSHFYGTSREPRFIPSMGPSGLVLTPFYDIINQTGVDVQATLDEWLWKFEVIHRSGQGETFNALTTGFEYTFVGVNDSAVDFGVIVEHLYDNRGSDIPVAFDNDLFVGGRFAFNDADSSEILFGVISDLQSNARFYNLEASRRIGDALVLTVEARFLSGIAPSDPLASVQHDDVIQIELAHHF